MKKKIRRTQLFLFLFLFSFVISSFAGIRCVWTGVKKIVAVGDLHGNYQGFVKILKGTGLIDEDLNWKGGDTHLVQLGDVMDRGPDAKKIFDLLMKLEPEAEKLGGVIHVLLGNHEEVNILGLAFGFSGYVTVDQFKSFLPEKYWKQKEKKIREEFIKQNPGSENPDNSLNEALLKYWAKTMSDPKLQLMYHESFMSVYGRWLLKKNAVIKLNNIVFTHGGVNKKYSKWKILQINEILRRELSMFSRGVSVSRTIAYQTDSPLWYRELARANENVFSEELKVIFNNLGAEFMVIAHTVRVKTDISAQKLSRFDGQVWTIDTGISEIYGGELSALMWENNTFKVWGEKNEK